MYLFGGDLPYSFKRKNFNDGLVASLPICLAFSMIFFSLGLLSNTKGLTLFESLVLSMSLFAGPSQIFIMDNQTMSLWAMALNIFILNFRLLFMSLIIVSLWKKGRRLAIPTLYFLTSSAYLATCVQQKSAKDLWSFFLGLTVTSYTISILFTYIGYNAWHLGDDYRSFLNAIAHIVLPIHFTCLTMNRKDEKMIILVTFLGFLLPGIVSAYIPSNMLILLWLSIAAVFVYAEEALNDRKFK